MGSPILSEQLERAMGQLFSIEDFDFMVQGSSMGFTTTYLMFNGSFNLFYTRRFIPASLIEIAALSFLGYKSYDLTRAGEWKRFLIFTSSFVMNILWCECEQIGQVRQRQR